MGPQRETPVIRHCDGWDQFFNLSFQDWLSRNLRYNMSWDDSVPWSLVFGVTCCVLWNWRNKRLFDEDFHDYTNPIGFIRFKTMQFNEACRFEENNGIKKAKEWRLVGWDCPPQGWYKFITDGVMKASC